MGFKRMNGSPRRLEAYIEVSKRMRNILVSYLPEMDQKILLAIYGYNFSKQIPYADPYYMKKLHVIIAKLRRLLIKYNNNKLGSKQRLFIVVDNPDIKEDKELVVNATVVVDLEETKNEKFSNGDENRDNNLEELIVTAEDLQGFNLIFKHLLRDENVKATLRKLHDAECTNYEIMVILMAVKKYNGKALSIREIASTLQISEEEVWNIFIKGMQILNNSDELNIEESSSLGMPMQFVFKPEVDNHE